MKFKYPRQRKTIQDAQGFKEINEINSNLRYVIEELDTICQQTESAMPEIDLKRKISTISAIWSMWCPIRSLKLKAIWKN